MVHSWAPTNGCQKLISRTPCQWQPESQGLKGAALESSSARLFPCKLHRHRRSSGEGRSCPGMMGEESKKRMEGREELTKPGRYGPYG